MATPQQQPTQPPQAGAGRPGTPGEKPLKDPRTPAQIKADEAATESRKMLDLWVRFKGFLVHAYSRNPIGEGDEKAFLEVASELQKRIRMMLSMIPKDIDFGHERMTKLLKSTISLQHLRELPSNDQMKIFNEWHSIYIMMTRAAGAMKFISEGYVHTVHMKREIDIRTMKKNLGQEEAVPFHKNPSAITMVLVVLAVGFFLLYYMGMLKF